MDTTIIKQKLHEYIDTASEESLEFLYQEIIEENGAVEWDEDFLIEMNKRRQEYLNGKVESVSMEDTINHAILAIEKVRVNAI